MIGMKTTHLVSLGLLCLLGVLVIALMAKTPVIRSFFKLSEGFSTQSVSTTQCPSGFTMYMYDGTAYCCNGTINTDAYTVAKSCVLPVMNSGVGFCTLGASSKVPNCGNLLNTILTQQSTSVCPPSKPNYAMSNRCCQSSTTSDGTDCSSKTLGTFCNVEAASELFRTSTDCNYLRMKETDTCPPNSSKVDVQITSGVLSGMNIYGCSNQSKTCYTDSVISALHRLGKVTTSLTSCTSPDALTTPACTIAPIILASDTGYTPSGIGSVTRFPTTTQIIFDSRIPTVNSSNVVTGYGFNSVLPPVGSAISGPFISPGTTLVSIANAPLPSNPYVPGLLATISQPVTGVNEARGNVFVYSFTPPSR